LQEKKLTDKVGLVDTNILVYLVDATDKKKHEKAKMFLDKIIQHPEIFVVSLQNLREFSSVLINKKKINKQKLEKYLDLFNGAFEEILYDNVDDIISASKESLDKKSSFWDSLLMATMKRNAIELIYTENLKDFKNFKNIESVNPLN